jgi:hypothetical protein
MTPHTLSPDWKHVIIAGITILGFMPMPMFVAFINVAGITSNDFMPMPMFGAPSHAWVG